MPNFSFDQRVSKLRRFGILKLSILFEKNAYLKNDFVQIFLLRIIMRWISLDRLIILKNRVKLLELLEPYPALAKQFFTKGSVKHYEVFHSTDDFFQLTEVLS